MIAIFHPEIFLVIAPGSDAHHIARYEASNVNGVFNPNDGHLMSKRGVPKYFGIPPLNSCIVGQNLKKRIYRIRIRDGNPLRRGGG
jgi:hypothetical protein